MTAEEIITSGKLELYITGSLPSEEISEIENAIAAHSEVRKEVESIEVALINLAEAVAPPLPAMVWTYVLNSIKKVRSIDDTASNRTNWAAMSGWAAAILCFAGIFWMLKQNNDLNDSIQVTNIQNTQLKEKVNLTEGELTKQNDLLAVIRSKDFNTIMLPGNQAVAPDAYAKVYYNKTENIAYIDANGLPTPPSGKVYQVWSLTLDPLTPTSMGLLEAVTDADKGVHKFENIPNPEAFGITLEPAGGSETPTLSQLYTLGTVASAP